MISRTLGSPHSSAAAEVLQITPPSNDVVQESRVLGFWMFLEVVLLVRVVEECVYDSQFVFGILC